MRLHGAFFIPFNLVFFLGTLMIVGSNVLTARIESK